MGTLQGESRVVCASQSRTAPKLIIDLFRGGERFLALSSPPFVSLHSRAGPAYLRSYLSLATPLLLLRAFARPNSQSDQNPKIQHFVLPKDVFLFPKATD